MKPYKYHERKVLGKPVHEDIKTKKKTKWHKSMNEKRFEKFKEAFTREDIESTYLVPEIENFVETPHIKKLKEKVKSWLKLGYPVHIIGPTGCGKTTIAMQVAKELGRPVVWINGDEQVTTTDLIGGYSQVEAEGLRDKYIHNVFKSKDILKADWVDNPLTLACKYGYSLVYNEFSRTLPIANNVLLSVFEEKILELPTMFGEQRYVKVHPNFTAIFTSNSVEYAGVHKPQDALLDRMVGIYMDYYDLDTEVDIVRAHTNLPKEGAERIVKVVRTLRNKMSDGEKPGTRACIMMGQIFKTLQNPSQSDLKEACIDVITTKTRGPVDLSKKTQLIESVFKGM